MTLLHKIQKKEQEIVKLNLSLKKLKRNLLGKQILNTEVPFGKAIQELRKHWNATQTEVAQELGIDVTYLSKIENGKVTSLSEDFITKVAQFFGVDPIEMIYLAGKIPDAHKKIILNDKKIRNFLTKQTKETK